MCSYVVSHDVVCRHQVKTHNQFVQKASESAPFSSETARDQSTLGASKEQTVISPLHLAFGNRGILQGKMREEHAR